MASGLSMPKLTLPMVLASTKFTFPLLTFLSSFIASKSFLISTFDKKVVKELPKVVKKTKPKKIKSKRKKLFPLEVKKGPGSKDRWQKLDPKSPYIHVDDLGARPLHRGTGPVSILQPLDVSGYSQNLYWAQYPH